MRRFVASDCVFESDGRSSVIDFSPEESLEPRESPLAKGKAIPLTEAQRGLWALGAMNRDGFKAYHESMTFEMSGSYDHDAMRRAFRTAIKRHESLRTWIDEENDSQFIQDEFQAELPVVDLETVEPELRKKSASEILAAEAAKLFEERTPMVRGLVIRLNSEKHYLMLTFHHLIGNGPSYSVFVNQLFDLYEGSEFIGEQMQLTEFVDLQPSLGQEADARFWEGQFRETVLPLELPLDYARPALRSFRGERVSLVLDAETCSQLRMTAASQRSSTFMALFGAFNTLLHRLSGQNDLVVGVPFDSKIRELNGGEALFANTTNVVPFRSRIPDNPTFAEYLENTKSWILSAVEHQEYFFGRLLTQLGTVQDPARPPLFSVIFNYENGEFSRRIRDLDVELLTESFPYRGPNETAMFELCVNVAERYGKLEIQCDFCSKLFSRETIGRWLGHYRTLLRVLIANPEARLLEIPLLDPSEWHEIVVEWNETHRPYRTDRLLHQFVEAQVELTPEAVALVFDGKSLSYGEMNRRANQLARTLIGKGVGPEKIVGILANRSFEMVIAILAVLKAGGAYLPLVVSDPEERIAFVIEDAQPTVVLAQSGLMSSLPADISVLSLDDDYSAQPTANPLNDAKPENTAYLIYTSGSTGKPKGVLNTHGGVSNWLLWMIDLFPLNGDDAMIQKSPYTFDVSVREFFLPLATGARLVIAHPGLHGDSRYLADLIKQNKITAIHFVPPMLSAFLDEPNVNECASSLKWVICSGDILTYSIQERFFSLFSGVNLYNLWGATETAPECSVWECRPGADRHLVPIGVPGANTQIYIVDQGLKPVPVGVTGEIFVGGIQVAKGYLRRPELTAQRFIPNPYGKGTLYRTGDLGRYLPNRNIEFIGRIDHQVKLRGFRIELGEIETVLQNHIAVIHCAVLVRGRDETSKRLVAYVVAPGSNAEVLREHAARQLPDYMVPAAFVFLAELPATPNGKLDRAALPEPIVERRTFVAPRNEKESALAKIWEEIFGLPQISVSDNFFDLGGNSLLALKMFHRIRKEFGTNLPLASLLAAPSIEKLAEKFCESATEADWGPLVAIQTSGNNPPFFGIHGVNGNILFYSKLSKLLGGNQPFYALQAQGLDGGLITRTTVEEMSNFYLAEIKRVQPRGPYFLGGYSFGGLAAYEIARTLRAMGEEVALLALFDTTNPASLPRLVSPLRKLAERIINPDGVDLNRLVHFFVQHARDPFRGRILKWNERFQQHLLAARGTEAGSMRSLELHLQTVYAKAYYAYRPAPYDGSMTIFRALKRPAGYEDIPDLGWHDLVAGGIEIRNVPGSHSKLFSDENVSILAEQLRESIERAKPGGIT
jgi:amino acid adenylation domain-containing protein